MLNFFNCPFRRYSSQHLTLPETLYTLRLSKGALRVLLWLFWLFLFRFRNNRIHGISIYKRALLLIFQIWIAISIPIFQPEVSLDRRGRPRRISRQTFTKRTRILPIPSKPHSFHSVHSAIGIRINGIIFRSFQKWNSSQKNTNTVYSEYS